MILRTGGTATTTADQPPPTNKPNVVGNFGKAISMNGLPNIGLSSSSNATAGTSASMQPQQQQQQQQPSYLNTMANIDPSRSNSLMSESSSQPDIHPFYKESLGKYIVLYSYAAQDENDLSVDRGAVVTVLNSDDPDWFWVARFDGFEGFVPAGFIYPLDAIQRQQSQQQRQQRQQQQQQQQQPTAAPRMINHLQQPITYHKPGLPNNNHHPQPPLGSQGSSSVATTTTATPAASYHLASPSGVSEQTQGPASDTQRYFGTEMVMLYDYKVRKPPH